MNHKGKQLISMSSILDARSMTVLRMRFLHDLTQVEIAERIGLSQWSVSTIIRNACERLRDYPNLVLDLESHEN